MNTGLSKGLNRTYPKGISHGTLKGLYSPKNNWSGQLLFNRKNLICLLDFGSKPYQGKTYNTIIPDTSIDATGIVNRTNFGTLFNPTGYKVNAGKIGHVAFNGTTGCIRLINTGGIVTWGFGSFSIGVWAKSTVAGRGTLAGCYNCNSYYIFEFGPTGTFRFIARDSGASQLLVETDNIYSDGRFHYAVAVRISGTIQIYVDGKFAKQTSGSLSILNTTGSLFFGTFNSSACPAINVGSENPLNGSIGRIEIYNTGLGATQIKNNFDALKERYVY